MKPVPVRIADICLYRYLYNSPSFSALLELGIGLTDLCKEHSGNDDQLPDGAFDLISFKRKVKRYQPQWIAFTSKTGAQAFLGRKADYGPQPETIGQTGFFVLPSPSGLATRFWDEQVWIDLASTVENTFNGTA